MALELERKYLDVDLQTVAKTLAALGAESSGPYFESNVVLDTPGLALFKSGKLLRLRLREWRDKADCILTFKLPVAEQTAPDIKIRRELETKLQDFEQAGQIMANLGYHPVASYEKVRDSWQVRLGKICAKVELDLLPFGQVVEIEGQTDSINEVAILLGLDKNKISTNSYHELNQEWQKANGFPVRPGFGFASEQKRILRLELGLQV